MYKIFVNDKPLTIRINELENIPNLPYEGKETFEITFKLLFNTKENGVNIYTHNYEEVWKKFQEFAIPVHAAGGIVKNKENKYLFIKRNGKWDLPKGHVEKGESIEKTALREVQEECSLNNLILNNFITTTYHIYKQEKWMLKVVHWFFMDYLEEETPKPQTEEDIELVDWFNKNEIPELLTNTFGSIKDLAEEYIINYNK